jgi:hypothetical protein
MYGSWFSNAYVNHFANDGIGFIHIAMPHIGLYLDDDARYLNLFGFINRLTLLAQMQRDVPYDFMPDYTAAYLLGPNQLVPAIEFVNHFRLTTRTLNVESVEILNQMLSIKSMLDAAKMVLKWPSHPVTGRYYEFAIQKYNCVTGIRLDVNTHPLYNLLFDKFNGNIVKVAENQWAITQVLIPVDKEMYPDLPDVTYAILINSVILADGKVTNRVLVEDPWKQLTGVFNIIESVIAELFDTYSQGKLKYFYF